jgi:hypothetical protein
MKRKGKRRVLVVVGSRGWGRGWPDGGSLVSLEWGTDKGEEEWKLEDEVHRKQQVSASKTQRRGFWLGRRRNGQRTRRGLAHFTWGLLLIADC